MRLVLFVIITSFLSVSLVSAQDIQETEIVNNYHDIPKTSENININASLDDPAWDSALKLTLDYEVNPGENIVPPVETEVYLIYSNKYLFIAFVAYDPNPSEIRARINARDNNRADDWVGIILDTYNDERRTYDFICNPLGVQTDMIESNYGAGGDSWDAIWNSAGRITDQGYIVEMAIPFRALNFQRSDSTQIWGVDAVRSYPRSVRHHIGLFPRDRDINSYMSQADKLVGFDGVTPGRNIEIDPTFSTVITQERTNGDFENTSERYDPGLTAHWGFTPSMKLSLAINPDFSQIEADAAQLDVNRQYAIYYPERRPFFLEGADFFGSGLPVIRFRSFADPEWGVKLAGKFGANSIGFCIVEDSITNILLPTSFSSYSTTVEKKNLGTVFRYRRDFGISSTAGIILTDREGDDYYNRMGGADFNFNATRYDRLTFTGGYSQTKYPEEISTNYGEPDTAFDGWSVLGGYYHNSRNINWFLNFWVMDPNFRGDLGFVYQSNYKNVSCGSNYKWYNTPDHWYNFLSIGWSYEYEKNFGDTLIYKDLTLFFNMAGLHQSFLNGSFHYGKNTYQGIEYDNRFVNFHAQFRPSGLIFISMFTRYGDQIDYLNVQLGKRFNISPYVEVNLGKNIYFEIEHNYEELTIDQGRLYTANITNLALIYHFTHRAFLRGILQYVNYDFNQDLYPYPIESQSKHFFNQALFSYKLNPQTVLYLGYSDNHRGNEIEPIIQTDRTFFAKVGYSFII